MTGPNPPRRTLVRAADADGIREAARLILAGRPVAVPTETVYGLAADATNAEAVAAIYAAKGRPSFNPLIIHVRTIEEAEAFGARPGEAARKIASLYWPGPLTLVVPLSPFASLARAATAGLGTVAVRSAAHPVMRALLEATGRPLAAPSANRSGAMSPTCADHVLQSLDGAIPLILDGGRTEHGLESTIVKVVDGEVTQLRPGPIDADDIAASSKFEFGTSWKEKIEAPGQLPSHYAPSKELRLDAAEAAPDEYHIGFGSVAGDASLSEAGDLAEAAARLFDLLHRADASGKRAIAVAPIPAQGIGLAIDDRLNRAAAPRA